MASMITHNLPRCRAPRRRTRKIVISRVVLPALLCMMMVFFFGMAAAAAALQDTTQDMSEDAAHNDTRGYQRIISLYSAHTENLVSLGAADQLVGISPSDNYPEHILDKQRFSYREDPERFIAARPDLVLVRPMIERSYPQLMDKLREIGISVVSLQPTTVEGIFDYWRELGRLSGHPRAAEEMIERFTSRLDEFSATVDAIAMENRPRVYFESMHRRMKTFAPSSIALFALKKAGGINVATDASQVRSTNIAAYSKERILAHADEIDVFIAQQGRMNPVTLDTIRNETGFQAIKAVRRDNIFLIDEHLVSRPTMRLLQGIEQLHELLYEQASLKGTGS